MDDPKAQGETLTSIIGLVAQNKKVKRRRRDDLHIHIANLELRHVQNHRI